MARLPDKGDFAVDVDGIGRFIFARRGMRETFSIRGAYNATTNGNFDEGGNMADLPALAFVTIQALLVKAPDGFDVEAIDPLEDPEWEDTLLKVFMALREKEASFRRKPPTDVQAPSESASA